MISVDGFYIEAPLKGELLFMVNQDVPGVIGRIGEILGGSGVNIADFSLGRLEATGDGPATAVSVVRVDQPTAVEEQAAGAEPLDRLHLVADEEDRAPGMRHILDLADALLLESRIAHGQHFVDQEDRRVTGPAAREPGG